MRTVLNEEVHIVAGLHIVFEVHNIFVLQFFPGLDLASNRFQEEILGNPLVGTLIDFLNQIGLGDHLAGEDGVVGFESQIGFGVTPLSQNIVFNFILIDSLQSLQLGHILSTLEGYQIILHQLVIIYKPKRFNSIP